MQHAGANEEHRDSLACPHHPQRLERGVSAEFGKVGGRGHRGEMLVAMFFPFLSLLNTFFTLILAYIK